MARAEFQAVMRRVLERIPDYTINEGGLIPYDRQSTASGWKALPVTFSPGRPLAPEDRAIETFTLEY